MIVLHANGRTVVRTVRVSRKGIELVLPKYPDINGVAVLPEKPDTSC